MQTPSPTSPSRRDLLTSGVTLAALTAGSTAASSALAAEAPVNTPAEPHAVFRYCLNTSTIRGQNLPLADVVDLVASTGYNALEPWISEIERYQQQGGSLPDLKKRIADHGLAVPSAIGFAEWIVDDDARRAKGVERMKHDMDLVSQIGGTRIAAPAAGLGGKDAPPSLDHIAERFRVIQDLGKQTGIAPELELWGPSKALGKLADVLYVAAAAGGDDPQFLLDIYHLHKGGSHLSALKFIRGSALPVLHTNDYPDLPREQLNDSMRVYPGDGVAPLTDLFKTLRDIGFHGYLSVELFNKDYWKQAPPKVAKTALEKTREAVQKAFT